MIDDFEFNSEAVGGVCRIENWDMELEEIKNVLGDDAYVKVHGTVDKDWYLFTALRMKK